MFKPENRNALSHCTVAGQVHLDKKTWIKQRKSVTYLSFGSGVNSGRRMVLLWLSQGLTRKAGG